MTNTPAAVFASPPPRFRVRWRICLFMLALSFLSYVQQRGLAVAGYRMMPELSLSQDQLGWLETAFLIGYAGMQLPGGILGQRLGARLMFVLIGIVAFVSTVAVPIAPLLLTVTALFAVLLGAQLLQPVRGNRCAHRPAARGSARTAAGRDLPGEPAEHRGAAPLDAGQDDRVIEDHAAQAEGDDEHHQPHPGGDSEQRRELAQDLTLLAGHYFDFCRRDLSELTSRQRERIRELADAGVFGEAGVPA